MNSNPDKDVHVNSHFTDHQFEKEQQLFPDVSHFFITNEIFPNRAEAEAWVRATGRSENMYFFVKRVNVYNKGSRKVWLGCEHGGKYRFDAKKDEADIKKNGSKKLKCKFEVYLVQQIDVGWRVKVSETNTRHNHPIAKETQWHTSASKLTVKEIERVDQLYSANVKPKQILNELKKEDPRNRSTIKHVENALVKIRKVKMGSQTKMQYFFNQMRQRGYISWYRCEENTKTLTDVMFAHPKSLELVVLFPYVLLMDTTYKTNKYDMPLLEIIGVTSTGKNYHVAFAFLKNERTDTFRWALRGLRGSLFLHAAAPDVIVTDRELALMTAVQDYFPESHHMLCKRHIAKDVEKYMLNLIKENKKEIAGVFMKRWTDVVESKTEAEYIANVAVMEDKWKNVPAILNYVTSQWLDPYRDRFVFAWTKQYMHFGQRTTNRVESAHSQLKRWLCTSSGGFDLIFTRIHDAVELQFNEIKTDFERSLNKAHPVTESSILFRRLRFKVSYYAINLLVNEWALKQSEEDQIKDDAEKCGCLFKFSYGLPCACEMWKMSQEKVAIEPHAVHQFWRTLSVSGDHDMSSARESADDLMKDILSDLKDEPEARKYHYLRQFHNFMHPESMGMRDPQSRPHKGRPKQNSTKRDLSGYEHANRQADKAARGRGRGRGQGQGRGGGRGKGRSTSSSGQPSTGNTFPYASQMPSFMIPFISSVLDVKADGNCGFRVIADFIYQDQEKWDQVRNDLMQEITENFNFYATINLMQQYVEEGYIQCNFHNSPAPSKHWLNLGSLGYVIATRYQRIVTCLCSNLNGCNTWLPMQARYVDGQPPEPPTAQIDIGWVNGNHFIALRIKPYSPMPRLPTHPAWENSCDPNIRHWLQIWTARLTTYLHLET